MSAKDKAKELINRFNFEHNVDSYLIFQTPEESKRCALITIDEMLDFRNGLYMNEGSIVHQYLLDVKQEIINQ